MRCPTPRVQIQVTAALVALLSLSGCGEKTDSKSAQQADTAAPVNDNAAVAKSEQPQLQQGDALSALPPGLSDVAALATFAPELWLPLGTHVVGNGAASAALAMALWSESDNLEKWVETLTWALLEDESKPSIRDSRELALQWIQASLGDAFPKGHQANRSVAIVSAQRLGPPLSEVQELQARALREKWRPLDRGSIALVVADAAMSEEDYGVALAAALSSQVSFKDLGDAARLNQAERMLVGALVHRQNWSSVFEIADRALVKKLRFRALSPYSSSYSREPAERARQELSEVCRWASSTTPEWARAVGVVAATTQSKELKAALLERFDTSVSEIQRGDTDDYGEGEVEVIVRQLRERGYEEMASRALQVASKTQQL